MEKKKNLKMVSAYYSSDEEVSWGPISLREIKRDLRDPPLKKVLNRHSCSRSYTSKVNLIPSQHVNLKAYDIRNRKDDSLIKNICDKDKGSGTYTEYLTSNKTSVRPTLEKQICTDQRNPEYNLYNFQSPLSDYRPKDSLCEDISIEESKDISNLDSVIVLSSDSSDEDDICLTSDKFICTDLLNAEYKPQSSLVHYNCSKDSLCSSDGDAFIVGSEDVRNEEDIFDEGNGLKCIGSSITHRINPEIKSPCQNKAASCNHNNMSDHLDIQSDCIISSENNSLSCTHDYNKADHKYRDLKKREDTNHFVEQNNCSLEGVQFSKQETFVAANGLNEEEISHIIEQTNETSYSEESDVSFMNDMGMNMDEQYNCSFGDENHFSDKEGTKAGGEFNGEEASHSIEQHSGRKKLEDFVASLMNDLRINICSHEDEDPVSQKRNVEDEDELNNEEIGRSIEQNTGSSASLRINVDEHQHNFSLGDVHHTSKKRKIEAGDEFNDSNKSECDQFFNTTMDEIDSLLNSKSACQDGKQYVDNHFPGAASKTTSQIPIPTKIQTPSTNKCFKVPQATSLKKLATPKQKVNTNLKKIVSPIALYIKYSPQPNIKVNLCKSEVKKKITPNKTTPKINVQKCDSLPKAIYKPSKYNFTSTTRKNLFIPPSIAKLVQEPQSIKHQEKLNRKFDDSALDLLLSTETNLTRASINESNIDVTNDISILVTKDTID